MDNKEKKQLVLDIFNKISMGQLKQVKEDIKLFQQEDLERVKSLFLANAVIAGSYKSVEYFVNDLGADVNHKVGDKNLLDVAKEKGLNKISSFLIQNGAEKAVDVVVEQTHSMLIKNKLSPPKPKPSFMR